MDHGKLTDNNGKVVDFRNVILIMTTNADAVELSKSAIGFIELIMKVPILKRLKKCLRRNFITV